MRQENCTYSEALKIIEGFKDNSFSTFEEKKREPSRFDIQLPKGCTEIFPEIHEKWILSRRFDPEKLKKTYEIKAVHLFGEWKFRLIIPVFLDKKLVSYVGRDVTGMAEQKYKNCKIEDSKKTVKECLYNIDSVEDVAVVVEGVTDVWRGGDGFIATFGTQFTSDQVKQLMGLKRVIIMFDSDANKQAEKLANAATSVVPNVEIVTLDEGDPADLSDVEMFKLRKELGL